MNTAEILQTIHRRVDISGVRADVSMQELDKIAMAAKHYQFICAFALPCFTVFPSTVTAPDESNFLASVREDSAVCQNSMGMSALP